MSKPLPIVKSRILRHMMRFGNQVMLKPQSVASHSFYVALMTLDLCQLLEVDDSVLLPALAKAILHDVPESEVTDIVYPVKKRLEGIPERLEEEVIKHYGLNKRYTWISDLGEWVVKISDMVEAFMQIIEEEMYGNITFAVNETKAEFLADIRDLILGVPNKTPRIIQAKFGEKIFQHIIKEYRLPLDAHIKREAITPRTLLTRAGDER